MTNKDSTTDSADEWEDMPSYGGHNDFNKHSQRTSKATSSQANRSDQDVSPDKSWTRRLLTIGPACFFVSAIGGMVTVTLAGPWVIDQLSLQTSNSQMGAYDTANTTSNSGTEAQPNIAFETANTTSNNGTEVQPKNIAFETTPAYHPKLGTAVQWQPQCPAGSEAPETLLLCASLPEDGGQCASFNAAWDPEDTKFVMRSLKDLGSEYYIAHDAFSKAESFIPEWMHRRPGRFEMPEEVWKEFLSKLRLNHYDPAQDDPAQGHI